MIRRLLSMFDLPAIGQVPLSLVPQNLVFDGALPDLGSLINAFAALTSGTANPGVGNQFSTSAAATITLTGTQGLVQRLTNGGAVTVTLDYAYNMVATIPFAYPSQTWPFNIITNAGTTVATPTLSDTAVTLSGTTTVLAAAMRWYQAQITQLVTVTGTPVTAGTTFTSIAQVGTTNAFTVTLVTNALVPVVGNVIYLNVTAGTLPAGWYPIVKVTSATSFIIATPPGTVWTATAATVPGTVVVPASQYTLGYTTGVAGTTAGVYSPLLTITGMMATVTAIMSV